MRLAVERLEFTPSAHARSLRSGSSGLIGVITFERASRYFDEVLEGMDEAARENGLALLIMHSNCEDEDESRAMDACISRGADALVVDAYSGTAATLERLGRMDLPCIVLQSIADSGKLDVIHPDDHSGGCLAARHLLALGHERFALVAGYSGPDHSIRNRGIAFERAVAEAGFPLSPGCRVDGDYSLAAGHAALVRLMALPERPTGIFLYSDVMALGALRAAKDLGLRVPEDVSIVGFDDIEDAAFSIPRLTTVRQPKRELGRLAVERLAERLKGAPRDPAAVALPVDLVVRESTGPAAPS